MSFHNVDASNRYMAVGVYGQDDSMTRFYIGSGTSPWSNGSGLYILPDGNVGIGAITPTHKLQVRDQVNGQETLPAIPKSIQMPPANISGSMPTTAAP